MPEPQLFALPGSSRKSRAPAFVVSLAFHAAAVALLMTATRSGWFDPGPTPSRRIALQDRKVIWYPRAADLPPVAPVEPSRGTLRAPAARALQAITARAPKPESRRQMVLQSPPELRLERDLRLPNLIAWNTPEPVAAPPPPKARFELPSRVPAAPRPLEAKAPQIAAAASPAPKALPVAPVQRPPRPEFRMAETSPRAPTPSRLEIAAAPEVSMPLTGDPDLARLQPKPLPRPRFVIPESAGSARAQRTALSEAAPPAVAAAQPNAVIVGLDPTPAEIRVLTPPGNRSAEFSAGPDGSDAGGNGSPTLTASAPSAIRVPNLSIAPAPAPTVARPPLPGVSQAAFRRQLLASVPAAPAAARPGSAPAEPQGADGVLYGSTVYTMAVDMPNITSQEGSWIVRFTELGGSSPEDVLTAPVATRKVDPAYNASAAAEGVEGKVLLYAVIRRDGRVDQIRLVQGIDERLDLSAVAAFAKWEFRPATKNGSPVDLEAVVQIPFRVGPRPRR